MGKQGIISPQVINHEEFLQTYPKTLEGKFAQQSINEDNFQFILDISNLKLWTTNTKIFCSITIPILEDQQWNIQRIYPIPHRQQGIFIAPLIDTPFLMTSKETYISLTEDYFPKNCKETAHLYLCKKTQLVHSKLGTQDCTNELINHHKEAKICTYVVFAIRELTFIPLRAENHFIIIPKEEITIDTFCDDHEPGHIVLSEAKLIYSNKPCSLVYHGNLMKIGGSTEEITYETRIKLPKINDTLDLNILSNNVKTAPVILNDYSKYTQTLNDIDDQINQLQYKHRIRQLKSYGLSTLQWLGYISLALMFLYDLHKCHVFNIISKCIPRKLHIQICCPKSIIQKNKTSTQPKETTNSEAVHPWLLEDINLPEITPARPKRVRFIKHTK